jgi:hypothetical protein
VILPLYGMFGPLGRQYAGPPASSLLTGLVGYWALDEASGNRADKVTPGHALVDNNTVESEAGGGSMGTVAKFTAASLEYFHISDTDGALDGGNQDYSYSVWVRTTAAAGSNVFLSKSNSSDHALMSNASGILRWESTSFATEANSLAAVNNGAWHHIVVWHDAAADRLRLTVDDGAVQSSGVLSTFFTDNVEFNVGRFGAAGGYFTGNLSRLGRWSKVLTASERTGLFGGGAPPDYPFSGV